MFRKIVIVLLALAVVPLVVPSQAFASHRTKSASYNGWNRTGWSHYGWNRNGYYNGWSLNGRNYNGYNGSLHCVTLTGWQPVSQFVLATNGVFIQAAQVHPVRQVQCFPVHSVHPVGARNVVVIRQDRHFRNFNGKFKRKVIVVHRRAHDYDDDYDDD